MTLADKEAVEKVRNVYEDLTEEQKATVPSEVLAKLEAAEAKILDLEQPEPTIYTVTFKDHDGKALKTEEVEHGNAATAPADPTREGYTFTGWDVAFDNVTGDLTVIAQYEIKTYTVSFDVTPGDATVVVTDSENNEVTAEEDGSYKLKPGNYIYTVNAESYIAKEASFTVDTTDQSITVDLEPLIVIGDETIDGLYIVNRDYTDNNLKSDDIGQVTLKNGDKDVTQSFDFTFYDQENGNEITHFDLSEGATTFRVFMEAISEEYEDISTYVVFKYRSVTIGDNDEYYTIEDALAEADLGDMVYVKYNTSFADTNIAEEVYDSTDFTIKSGVTLLLPYSSDLSSKTNDTPSGTSGVLSRDNAYVELTIPTGIELNVDGILTINAMRANISTRFSGHVIGTNYAQLHLKEGSKITVKDGGILNSIGFVYGNGIVEALSGSNIYESMFVKSFRGGTATLRVYSDVFPFDQYTVNNIEVDMTINSGANYTGKALIYASSSYTGGDAKLVGNQTDYLLQLTEGKIIKTYDQMTGRVSFEIHGDANINNTSFKVGSITASSNGRDLPFDGTWSITAADGSNLTINSWVMLLPGASVNIEPEAEVTVSENGKITVFDPYEHIDTYNTYPVDARAYYRVAPEFDFDSETPATLNVDGTLVVKGGLAGRVHKGEMGSISLLESACTTYDVKYVYGSAGDATVYSREVSLWYEGESTIAVVANPSTAKSGEKIVVTTTLKNAYGNPLEGIEVVFSGGNGSWSSESIFTNSNGKAESVYTVSGDDDNPTTLIATEQESNKTARANIEIGGGFSCPFVYSYDGEKYYFEHEAIPFAVNKALETTSYGTLRKLNEVDGKYHVRIVEMLDEKSFVNSFRLIAVDYPENKGIKEVFADIYGEPHTIQERIAPIEFIDYRGSSKLEEITSKGKLVGSDYSMLYKGEYITPYEATFAKPQDDIETAKLMISTKKTYLITQSWNWFLDKIDGSNNIWWIEKAMGLSEFEEIFTDFINLVNLRVELWNGEEWVKQGEIKAGMDILEEFLIPLDLGIINYETDEIKVRITSGGGLYEIDQVSIDFSQNEIINIVELEPEIALLNNEKDVKEVIGDSGNDKHVKMIFGDKIDLIYDSPELDEGSERGFMVALKGYYHTDPNSKENAIVNEWDGMHFEDIIAELHAIPDEDAIAIMEDFFWMADLIESLYGAPLEGKVEKVIVNHVLPWLN